MILKVKIERKGLQPFSMPRQFWNEVGDLVIGSTVDNILGQQQAEGGALKTNAPSTRERKRRRGQPLLSLIDRERRLVKPGMYQKTVAGQSVTVRLTGKALEISRYVQQMGYVGWLGLNRKARQALRLLARKHIEQAIRQAR